MLYILHKTFLVSLADVQIEVPIVTVGHEEFHFQEADTVDYLFIPPFKIHKACFVFIN